MAQTIDRVQVEIEATAKGTSQIFAQLERQMTTLKNALASIDTSKLTAATRIANTGGMSKTEREISSSVNRIKESFASLKSYKDAALSGDSSSLTSFSRKVINLQSQIDALGKKMELAGNTKTGLSIDSDSLQTYRDSLAEIQQMLNTATSEVAAFQAQQNNAGGDSGLEETKVDLEDIKSKLQAVSKGFTTFKNNIKNAISSVRSSLSKLKDTITSIGNGTSNIFNTGFMKILKYGLGIRSLYVLFRRLRQAIKDSFTELQNSGADFATTKANIEALKNSLTTLKYQFGAAFEPIFNTVAPALQTLINYLVAVMNTISAFIAKLTGKSTYSKAVVATGEIAKNTGSAAGSAKELNKQLQGFDELNNLTQNNGSGGGGGSGSSSGSDVMYEEASVSDALSSFWDSLADNIKAGNWETVGSMISEKLTSALNSIDWDKVFSVASNFGTNFARFLNGLITSDLFTALGTTIGNAIKTALTALNSFGTTFDWSNFGKSIGDGINAFVATNPLDLAVTTFNTWANGILDTLVKSIKTISWTTIGQQIADAIGNVDASGIGWKLGTLVTSLLNAFYDVISNKNTWTNLGQKIADGINGYFEGFEGSKLAKTANSIKDALFNTIKTAIKNIDWSEVETDIESFLGDLDIGTITLAITGVMLATGAAQNLLLWATTAILGKLSALTMATMGVSLGVLAINVAGVIIAAGAAFKIGWEFGNTFGEWIAQVLKNNGLISDTANDEYYEIAESMTMMEKINDIKLSIKEGTFTRAWNEMISDWYEPYNQEIAQIAVKVKSIALELVEGWNNVNDEIWDPVFELGEDIWDGIKEGFVDAISWVSPIGSLLTKIVEAIKNKFGIHSPATTMKPYGEDIFNGIIEGFKNMFSGDSIKNLISTLKDKIVSALTDKFKDFKLGNVVSTLGDVAVNITTTFSGAVKKFADFTNLDDTLDNIKTGYKNMKAKLTTTMEGVASSVDDLGTIKTKFTELTDSWKDKASKLKANVGGQLSKISDIDTWKSKFTNLYNAWQDKSSTMKANVGGQIKSIDDLSTSKSSWKDKFLGLFNVWNNKDATYSTKVGGEIKNIDELSTSKGSWKEKFTNLYDAWKNKSAEFKATADSKEPKDSIDSGDYKYAKDNWKGTTVEFKASPNTSDVTYSMTHDEKDSLMRVKSDWEKTVAWATFTGWTDLADVNYSFNNPGGDFYKLWDSWNKEVATATFTAEFSYDESAMNNFAKNLKQKLKEQLQLTMRLSTEGGTVQVKAYNEALGGSYYGGAWHNIPQYAGGGAPNHGSMFIAGEAGPEIVGHLNGRTEVLNKSQIAATIHSAFVSSMAQFGNRMLATPESVAIQSGSYSTYNASSNGDGQTAMLAEQNRLLAEQNQLLREIASKDVSISSRDVFNAVKSESNRFNNRTGGSPFLF